LFERKDGRSEKISRRRPAANFMSTVIVTGAAGLAGPENVQRFARAGFRVANRWKLIKPV
jgi:hypothetical protein